MGTFYGADVAGLRRLGKQIQMSRDTLSRLDSALNQSIEAARQWNGPDAQQFRAEWASSHRKALAQARALLAAVERTVLSNAQEQETASQGGSSAGAGSTASGPGDGTGDPSGGGSDHSTPRFPDRGKPDLSEDRLKDLRDKIHKAADPDDFFKGNDSDVEELRKSLEGLSPAQLDQLLRSLSDDELKALGQGLTSDGKGLFNWEGTTPFERQAVMDQLLAKASPEQLERLRAQIPWAQPDGASMGDAARPGSTSDDSNRWKSDSGPVIGDHPSANDIQQRGYGDCVIMSQLGALTTTDPHWAQNHVTDNGNGTVSVKLYDGGHERWVTVPKDLPATADGGYKGAEPGPGGSWASYVEKAIAQVYTDDTDADGPGDIKQDPGHYKAIEGNYGPEAMKYLSPEPAHQSKNADDVWKAVDAGHPAIITTLGSKPDNAPDGYHAGHAYFVTGKDPDGNLVLQNPWGPHEPLMHVSQEQFEKMFNDATYAGK